MIWQRTVLTRATPWAVVALLAGVVPSFAQDAPSPPPKPVLNNDQLFKKYVLDTLGPEGAVGAAVSAGLQQWRGKPQEWGDGTEGYAKRWSSEYAAHALGGTATYAVAKALHHDPSFAQCGCTGFGRRFAHAISAPFKARNRAGRWVWSPATAAGILTAQMVPAATWYPEEDGVRSGVKHVGASVTGKIGVNLLREFMPPRWMKFPPR